MAYLRKEFEEIMRLPIKKEILSITQVAINKNLEYFKSLYPTTKSKQP